MNYLILLFCMAFAQCMDTHQSAGVFQGTLILLNVPLRYAGSQAAQLTQVWGCQIAKSALLATAFVANKIHSGKSQTTSAQKIYVPVSLLIEKKENEGVTISINQSARDVQCMGIGLIAFEKLLGKLLADAKITPAYDAQDKDDLIAAGILSYAGSTIVHGEHGYSFQNS
jgi:hypothetical protein